MVTNRMGSKDSNILRKIGIYIGTIVLIAYSWPATLFFFPYYNWKYAQEKGFTEWLSWGEVIATGKAIIWPYFVFFDDSPIIYVYGKDMKHFSQSLKYANRAGEIINEGKSYEPIDIDDMSEIVKLYKKALIEANYVDFDKLNELYDGYGNYYNNFFIKGLKLYIARIIHKI